MTIDAYDNQKQEIREFINAFKRVIKMTFVQARRIIDETYFRKHNITVSSLAELSLGFFALFYNDLLEIDPEDAQVKIVGNDVLVEQCYFVMEFAKSVDDLTNILDWLASRVAVLFRSEIELFAAAMRKDTANVE